MSEFDRKGRLVFDAYFGHGKQPGEDADTYRAYRLIWHGKPAEPPAIAVAGGKVYVSWNGATEVKRWQVLVGNANDDLTVVAAAAKSGFETAIPFHAKGQFVAVQALDGKGRVIGVSRTLSLKH